jgi:hypothetical protein
MKTATELIEEYRIHLIEKHGLTPDVIDARFSRGELLEASEAYLHCAELMKMVGPDVEGIHNAFCHRDTKQGYQAAWGGWPQSIHRSLFEVPDSVGKCLVRSAAYLCAEADRVLRKEEDPLGGYSPATTPDPLWKQEALKTLGLPPTVEETPAALPSESLQNID